MNKTILAGLVAFGLTAATASAQGTSFTVEGVLKRGAFGSRTLANGDHDFAFTVFNAPTNGTVVGAPIFLPNVPVDNGVFDVRIDFGNAVFTGPTRWLEISVRPSGSGTIETLSPRQEFTSAPYAVKASKADTAETVTGQVSAEQIVGELPVIALPNGGIELGKLSDTVVSNTFWRVGGNEGTTGANFLGTTDDRPLEFRVNGMLALRIEPVLTSSGLPRPNFIAGSSSNRIIDVVQGANIGGGHANTIQNSDYAAIGGGEHNQIGERAEYSTISGGLINRIAAHSEYSAIGGGYFNVIWDDSDYSTIAGGQGNDIGTNSPYSFVGGGQGNDIGTNSPHSFIGGGFNHYIAANAPFSVIGGGYLNTIWESSVSATIAGGYSNEIGTNSPNSAIGGGSYNLIGANSGLVTIAGGSFNEIGTNASFSTLGGGERNSIGSNSTYAVIVAGRQNSIYPNSSFASVGGGSVNGIGPNANASTIAGGSNNGIGSNSYGGAVSGGSINKIGAESQHSTIAGGNDNRIGTNSEFSVIGGGRNHRVWNNSPNATIGGGRNHSIGTNSDQGTIGGGYGNIIGTNSSDGIIGGGNQNRILDNAPFATIPGGVYNTATNYAFAAGRQAKADHTGAFVWADAQGGNFSSTSNNQFLVRASGGVGIGTNNPQSELHVSGTVTADAFVGDGSGLLNVVSTAIVTNSFAATNEIGDAQLPATVARLNTNQTFTALNTFSGVTTATNAGNQFGGTFNGAHVGSFTGDGGGLSNVWSWNGNSGTVPGTHFLGTTDNQPLELKVNAQRVLRLEYVTDGGEDSVNIIGGFSGNFVDNGVIGAAIAGGGRLYHENYVRANYGAIGGGRANHIESDSTQATIAGGYFNEIDTNSPYAAIGGGRGNGIGTNSSYSAIGGGYNSRIADNSLGSTIVGGRFNDIGTFSYLSTIAGGEENGIWANSIYSVIGGGRQNYVLTNSPYSAIGGGEFNIIAVKSDLSTIAGGYANYIGTNSSRSAIGGGGNNRIAAESYSATIAGGVSNEIGTNSGGSSIGGGGNNHIAAKSFTATIAGGSSNYIGTNSSDSAIGGGYNNRIAANAPYATIPGGYQNAATNYAFAAGTQAKADHTGAFVWADSEGGNFSSTSNNQFLIRASGGVGIGTNNPQSELHVRGTVTADAFEGDGSGLTNLSLALPANVALLNSNQTFTGTNRFSPAFGAPFTVSSVTKVANLNADLLDGLDSGAFALSAHAHAAEEITSGTLNDGRLSANVAQLSGSQTFSGAKAMTNAGNTFVGAFTGSFTGNGAGLTNLGLGSAATNTAFLNSNQIFSASNVFKGVVTMTNGSNSFVGGFTGNGAGVTNLNAGALASGTVPDARLSNNVARLNAIQTFTGTNTFSPASGAPFLVSSTTKVTSLNADLLDGLESSAFALSTHTHAATDITSGTLSDARLSNSVAMRVVSNIFTSPNTFLSTVVATNASNQLGGSFNGFASGNGAGLTNLNIGAVAVPWANLTGVPGGFVDGVDNDTTYTAGNGLTLAGTQFNVSYAGSGAATTASRSNHAHSATDIVSGTLSDLRLSSDVARRGVSNIFTSLNTFLGTLVATNGSNQLGGLFNGFVSGNGAGLTNLPSTGAASNAWNLTGNAGTSPTVNFVGTTDGKPLILKSTGGIGIGTTNPTAPFHVVASRAGNFSTPVTYIENTNTAGSSSPALRLAASNAVDGVLNVSAFGTGKIAAFGANALGEVLNLDTNGNFNFGTRTRQMLSLWSTNYGIGVQNFTFYSRSDGGFAWFKQGTHTDTQNNPGGGTTLMTLDSSGNLSANSFSGNGSLLTGVNADLLDGLDSTQFWRTGGNAGTTGANFLGTTDNQALDFKVNGARAWRLEPNANSPNVIGGFAGNRVDGGAYGAVVGGGGGFNPETGTYGSNQVTGSFSSVGGGWGNLVDGYYSVVGGGFWNTSSIYASTVSGGFGNRATNIGAVVAGGGVNLASGWYTSVGGGNGNKATNNYATVGGGRSNKAGGLNATIGGGDDNDALSSYATIGGGLDNWIESGATKATIAGGQLNTIIDNAWFGAIGGGSENWIGSSAQWSTIPGGQGNVVSASWSLAAGLSANANHPGCFVWADSQNIPLYTTANNQFLVRAAGGVAINTNNAGGASLSVNGGIRASGGPPGGAGGNDNGYSFNGTGSDNASGLFSSAAGQLEFYNNASEKVRITSIGRVGIGHSSPTALLHVNGTGRFENDLYVDGDVTITGTVNPPSDRNVKQDFAAADPLMVLEKVAALSIQSWAYTNSAGIRHLGPVAQDFHAAFGLGTDDRHISTVDADGVALAAIQGLNKKVEEKEARIQELEKSVHELKELVRQIAAGQKGEAR